MNVKCRNRKYIGGIILVACRYSAAHAGDPWEGSPVSNCYSSVESYVESKFGIEYKLDENIRIWQLREIGKSTQVDKFIWVADLTTGKNWSQTLFRKEKSGRACAILMTVMSSSVSLNNIKDGRLPTFVTTEEQVSAGWAARVVYRLDNKSRNYRASRCYRINGDGRMRSVECIKAFETEGDSYAQK